MLLGRLGFHRIKKTYFSSCLTALLEDLCLIKVGLFARNMAPMILFPSDPNKKMSVSEVALLFLPFKLRFLASIVPFSLSTDWFANDGAMIGLFNNGTGWKWVNGQPATYTNWLKTPNATDFGWVMFEYGYKEGHRNQWVLGGTFYYDGCAVLICEKVIK